MSPQRLILFFTLIISIVFSQTAKSQDPANNNNSNYGDGINTGTPNSQSTCNNNCTLCQYPCQQPQPPAPPSGGYQPYAGPPPPCPPAVPVQCCGGGGGGVQGQYYSPPFYYPYNNGSVFAGAPKSFGVQILMVLCYSFLFTHFLI